MFYLLNKIVHLHRTGGAHALSTLRGVFYKTLARLSPHER
jgi:hypothetical protein